MNLFIELALEVFTDTLWFLGPSDKETEEVRTLVKRRNGELSNHADEMIDSDKSYLLLATKDGLYLVHRKKKWKRKLDTFAKSLYEKRGKKRKKGFQTYA